MFNCSSFYQSISPVFYLSNFFGFAPFSLPSKNGILKAYFFNYCFFLLNILLYLYIVYYVISDVIPNMLIHYVSDSTVFNTISVALLFWILITAIISLSVTMFLRHTLLQILKTINECDKQVYVKRRLVWAYMSQVSRSKLLMIVYTNRRFIHKTIHDPDNHLITASIIGSPKNLESGL